MAERPALPPFAAIVVAAGKGLRVGGDTPKQFREWRGKPLIRYSVETLIAAGASPLVIVVAPDAHEHADRALVGVDGYTLVDGGASHPVMADIISELGDRIPDAEWVTVPEARHMVPVSHAEMLAEAVEGRLFV